MKIQVAHAKHPTFGFPPEPQYPSDYTTVATVEVPEGIDPDQYLEEAFRLTNSIDSNWWENKGVHPKVVPCRSTSVGDVMVLSDGRKFRVDFCGCKELP